MSLAEVVYDKYTEIALDLERQSWCVWPGFMDAAQVQALAQEALAQREAGEFRHAGIGHGKSFQIRPEIRCDYVNWLQPGETSALQTLYLNELEQLRLAINRELFLGLFEFEGHLAIYPPGGFYARHRDQFAGVSYRIVTCILYLNPRWQQGDGGELRMYLPDGPLDIMPLGGTLVSFLSAEIEHEVLISNSERLSITGWFRRQ